jgi:hypothetical protein
MKLFDVTRRILMYTKDSDMYKRTYAICRGSFPIHELCGTMTALLLARRDVLGVNLPQWQIIGPAVLIHGMANFRGMKVSVADNIQHSHVFKVMFSNILFLLAFSLFHGAANI